MKHSCTLFIFFLLIIMVGISSCKKDKNSFSSENEKIFYEGYKVLEGGYDKFFELAAQNNTNVYKALEGTAEWAGKNEYVKSTYILDSTYLYVVLSNEMKMLIILNYIDEEGKSLYRGAKGGQNSILMKSANTKPCTHTIENKKVLFWGAQNKEFRTSYFTMEYILNNSDIDFDITVLEDEACTAATLKSIGQYGIVVLDTHGGEDFTMLGEVLDFKEKVSTELDFKRVLKESVGADVYEMCMNDEIMLCTSIKIPQMAQSAEWWTNPENKMDKGKYDLLATTKFIQNIPDVTGTVIFNNSCYSGATKYSDNERIMKGQSNRTLPTAGGAYISLNPIAYFGWAASDKSSTPVWSHTCQFALNSFVKHLAINDSTGLLRFNIEDNNPIHNGDDFVFPAPSILGIDVVLHLFRNDNYCYEQSCGPITDARDGKEYQTVCIGEQRWFAENLNWEGAGRMYDDDPANGEKYGRLYSIDQLTLGQNSNQGDTVRGVCPEGWHVPSRDEYQKLIDFCGGPSEASKKLKTASDWPAGNNNTNEFGFSLLPGGFYVESNINIFNNMGKGAKLWTSSITNDFYFLAINAYDDGFYISPYSSGNSEDENFFFSCRCVEDE